MQVSFYVYLEWYLKYSKFKAFQFYMWKVFRCFSHFSDFCPIINADVFCAVCHKTSFLVAFLVLLASKSPRRFALQSMKVKELLACFVRLFCPQKRFYMLSKATLLNKLILDFLWHFYWQNLRCSVGCIEQTFNHGNLLSFMHLIFDFLCNKRS